MVASLVPIAIASGTGNGLNLFSVNFVVSVVNSGQFLSSYLFGDILFHCHYCFCHIFLKHLFALKDINFEALNLLMLKVFSPFCFYLQLISSKLQVS